MNLCLDKIIFDTGIPNLAHGFITIRQHVVYIHALPMTLTFDLYVGSGVSLVIFTHSFNLVVKVTLWLYLLDPAYEFCDY